MAKARSRAAAKKVKDKWKAKTWYQILAPPLFDSVPVAETLADAPSSVIGRITDVSLQDLTNDFRKSHIKMLFKIYKVEENQAYTQIAGHSLTSDYIRRMIRRRRSRVDGVYDVTSRDGAIFRVKTFAIAEKRIQSSQKKAIREVMRKTIVDSGATLTLNEFIRDALDGKVGSDIYKNCKNLYPVKRIEISKTEITQQPTIEIQIEKKPEKTEEEAPEQPVTTETPEVKEGEVIEKEPAVEKKEKKKTTKKTAKKPAKEKTSKKKTAAKPKTKKKPKE
ncbi:MAG: 30S ribosomal protein S3ae [Methanobacteriota archaeon]